MKTKLFVAMLFVAMVVVLALFPPLLGQQGDFVNTYRPAVMELLHFRNPYAITTFWNAPWALLPLAVYAWLPDHLARAIHLALGFSCFAFTAYKLGAKPLALAFFMLSPTVLGGLVNGNVDWLAMLGFVMPPAVGLFFVVIKPQVGIGIALYWLYRAYRERTILATFAPIFITALCSFAVFGLWPLLWSQAEHSVWIVNTSLWPLSIPLGVLCLFLAMRWTKPKVALAAGPMLSPYVLFASWSASLLALVSNEGACLLAVGGLWLLVAFRALA